MTPAPWMNDPTVIKVVDALGASECDVRFVGGCVRDAVLGRETSDIDIATPDLPETVIDKLTQAGLKAVPTGLSHGTVTAVADGRGFEVTTLRKDTACDGRHAAVEFTTDWQEDASRRDFTFNAMSLRPDGTLFDPFGGVADAKAGIVRFVGNPQDRIREDYLRLLRYFRFLAHYGRSSPCSDLTRIFKELRPGLDQLSAERVRVELMKLLQADSPLDAVEAMGRSGVLAQVVGDEVDCATLASLLQREQQARSAGYRGNEWPPRWVALFEARSKDLSQRLRCSAKEQKYIASIWEAARRAEAASDPPALYHYVNDFDEAAARAGVLVAWAREHAPGRSDARWLDQYARVSAQSPKPFPIAGADIRALGITEGPEIGAILADLKTLWIESGFTLARDDLKQRLQTLITTAGPSKK